MMQYLSVANLSKYQHYSKRNPPWVKLHREFITDYTIRTFSIPTRFLFSCLWLIASETENKIPYNLAWLSERIGMKVTALILEPLLASSLCSVSVSVSVSPLSLTENSAVLAGGKQDASVVLAESSSLLREKFERFWAGYPRKVGKGAARKAWNKLKPVNGLCETICQQVEKAKQTEQWTKEAGKFIPNPATWLNQARWEDTYEPANTTQSTHSGFAQKDYRAGTW
jgi:hypothetical protein